MQCCFVLCKIKELQTAALYTVIFISGEHRVKGFTQIVYKIVCVFKSGGYADEVVLDAGTAAMLIIKLRVGSLREVHYQRADIPDVHMLGEIVQVLDKPVQLLLAAVKAK